MNRQQRRESARLLRREIRGYIKRGLTPVGVDQASEIAHGDIFTIAGHPQRFVGIKLPKNQQAAS